MRNCSTLCIFSIRLAKESPLPLVHNADGGFSVYGFSKYIDHSKLLLLLHTVYGEQIHNGCVRANRYGCSARLGHLTCDI